MSSSEAIWTWVARTYLKIYHMSCSRRHLFAGAMKRAAFDIGSGATKLMVAEVKDGKVVKDRPMAQGLPVGRRPCLPLSVLAESP